jgi:Uma2 family endonuclease
VGAPDLVVEVVSASSVKKDLQTLRAAYARAGIPEYWIIDARADAIRFLILHLDGGEYREAAPVTEPQPSRVFARRFRLTRARNEVGRYAYDLAVIP